MVSNMSSFPLQPALKVRKIRFKGSVTSGLRLCGE
jgi:hypothetical protein